MTKRERELLLEILLLHSRYTNDEFRAVSRALIQSEFDVDDIFKALSAVDGPRSAGRAGKRASLPRALFLQRIRDKKRMTLKDLGTLAEIIGVKGQDLSRDDLIRSVDQKISSLTDDEFAKFSSDFIKDSADKSYINLANFLINR